MLKIIYCLVFLVGPKLIKWFKKIDIWWFYNSFLVRLHFCHKGVHMVQNLFREYK